MKMLDTTSVTDDFIKIAKLTSEESTSYAPLIASAQGYFEKLLTREPDEGEMALAVYACAAKAFYDYTVLKAAESKVYSSQSGGIFARSYDDRTVKSAECLWRNAMAALPAGLILDDGFIFIETGAE